LKINEDHATVEEFGEIKQSLIVVREEFKDSRAKPAKPKKDQVDPLIDLVKNTYKTLMTRGMKGCYIYCCDEGLEKYIWECSQQ
jgi:DUF2075 family protein